MKEADTREDILHDAIYIKFKDRQNSSMEKKKDQNHDCLQRKKVCWKGSPKAFCVDKNIFYLGWHGTYEDICVYPKLIDLYGSVYFILCKFIQLKKSSGCLDTF